MKKKMYCLMAVLAAMAAGAENVVNYRYVVDHTIDVRVEDTRIVDGGYVEAPQHRFSVAGEGTTHFTMEGGKLIGTGTYGQLKMDDRVTDRPQTGCQNDESAICLGYNNGYVVADLAGGEIECPNGMFTVSRLAYTTCICTGTVIRCRGFRLQAGPDTGYATFILGKGGVLDITGEWGLRSYHDDNDQEVYTVGNPYFRYYLELRGGKIRFSNSYNHPGRVDLSSAPCLIMAPDTESEFEVTDGNYVHYAGQLAGEGTLRKTGGGTLCLASGFIHNTGTIVVEEGTLEMFYGTDKSRYYGDVIVKPGAKLSLKGYDEPVDDIPDIIYVMQKDSESDQGRGYPASTAQVIIEEGGEVYYSRTTSANTDTVSWTKKVDMNEYVENGGVIERRKKYQIGVDVNFGTAYWWDIPENIEDHAVGGYLDDIDQWTRQREVGNNIYQKDNYLKHEVNDIMRIYARGNFDSFIKLYLWAEKSATTQCPPPTNGNMIVTSYYLHDGLQQGGSSVSAKSDTVVVTNVMYKKEFKELPAPPNPRSWQLRLEDIPYTEFDIYLIYACDYAENRPMTYPTYFAPVKIRLTTADGKQVSDWKTYSFNPHDGENGKTVRDDAGAFPYWGDGITGYCETNMVEGVNFLRLRLQLSEAEAIGLCNIEDLTGVSVDIVPGETELHGTAPNQYFIRAGLAGIQIVPSTKPKPQLDINEYTSFKANANLYNLDEGDPITLDFTSTNETCSIGFVHSISNEVHVASRIIVNGKEYPKYPGEESQYSFSAVNNEMINLDVKYLPWRDNQTNDLTLAQFIWVTNRWDGGEGTISNRTLNSASAIAGADSDGDDFQFQFEYITDSDITKNSNPMHLVIVDRAISNDCLYLDVEYTRTEDGIPALDDNGNVMHGWLGVTNGMNNAEFLHLGMRSGMRFTFDNDVLTSYTDDDARLGDLRTNKKWRGPNPTFNNTITNTIVLPLTELTNRYFRAIMEPKK